MMKRLELAVVLALVGAWACGDDSRPDVVPDSEGGRTTVPSAGATSTAGLGGAGGQADAGAGGDVAAAEGGTAGDPEPVPEDAAPQVTIVSPEPAADPSSSAVLTNHQVEVICLARPSELPGAAPVQPGSVTIGIYDSSGTSVKEASGVATGEPNEYSAVLVLPELPNGPVTLRCSANDSAPQPHVGTDIVETFFDSGPTITIREPAKDSPHSLRGAIQVEFLVDPAPLADPDPLAEIDAVSLIVQGVTLDTTAKGNLYSATLDLNDLKKFPVTPTDQVPVSIRATNKRKVERRSSYSFRVDSQGPEIVFEAPAERDVVGGQTPIVFTVTDDKIGVDPDSIVVYVNQEEHRYDGSASWSVQGNRYTFRYDWAQVGTELSQVSVNILASDLATNVARGASRLFHVDNIPPYISLDPPNVREIEPSGSTFRCSPPFDPLFASMSDAGVANEHLLVRAFVAERTNRGVGQSIVFPAGTNRASVRVYLQTDPDVPLLTDARGNDGLCDDIFDVDAINSFQQLVGLTDAGPLVGGDRRPGDAPVIEAEACTDAPVNSTPICGGKSDMYRVVYDHYLDEPTIYAVAPGGGPSALTCAGITWQIRPNYTRRAGWACLAAVVEDNVGNRDVSAPLRVCLSDKLNPASDCPIAQMPTCTDGCDPSFYDPSAPELPWQIPMLEAQ